MRGVALRLSGLVLAFALAAPAAQADSWTELEQASIEAYGRAWFAALCSGDPSKLDRYLPTAELVGEALDALRELAGEEAVQGQLRVIEREGGIDARLREVRELVRESVQRLATSKRLDWQAARLELVTAASGVVGVDWPVARTHHVVLVIQGAASLHRVSVPAIATPHGARVPLALLPVDFLDASEEQEAAEQGFRIRVGFDVASAAKLQLGGPRATPDVATEVVAAAVRDYLARSGPHGLQGVKARVIGPGVLELLVSSRSQAEHLQGALSREGSVGKPTQMRIEVVLVPAQQAGDDGKAPEHAQQFLRDRVEAAPWQGAGDSFPATADGLAAYRAHEVSRFVEARNAGVPYVPTDPRYELVFGPRTDDWSVDNAHLLEAESSPITFESSWVRDVRVGIDPNNNHPVVLYDLTPSGAERLAAWSERNLGLPAAVLVNGRWTMAPRINGRLTDSVQITLGPGTREELEAQARQIVRGMLGPISPVPLTLHSVEPR
ncbi:MAG: hypothetical protein AB7T63_00650 [Planctomycetota bacterium]